MACAGWERNKGECDRQMVKSLDEIPHGEMPYGVEQHDLY